MDHYQVLGLSKNFTLEQLKKNYKKLVLKYHPDIAITSSLNTPIFQALTESYRYLYDEYTNREKEVDHYKLKQKFNYDSQHTQKANPDMMKRSSEKSKFDIDQFNRLYDKYAIKDDNNEKGYGDWLKSNDNNNDTYKAVINYEEPQPIFASKVVGMYNEIGADNNDFTNYDGKLPYMDLMKAHTMTKIVDESAVKMPPSFKNMEQIKAHRSNIEYVMTPEEKHEYEIKQHHLMKMEMRRQKKVREDDERIAEIYKKTHKLMLEGLK
jgi:curved DNA-binding protein CbpA